MSPSPPGTQNGVAVATELAEVGDLGNPQAREAELPEFVPEDDAGTSQQP
jgi:hypothetical protein